MDEGGGRGNLPGKWLGETVGEDRRKRWGAGSGEAQQGTGVGPVPGGVSV